MLAERPSSSSKTAALVALFAVLAISGCSGGVHPARHSEREAAPSPQGGGHIEPASGAAVTQAAAEPSPTSSPWCTYLAEDAEAQASILRSPSIGGQADDDGNASLSVGLSVSDFHKAALVRESAEARCRRHLAESGLRKMVLMGPMELTAAGFRAKAAAIAEKNDEINGLRREIDDALAAGHLDAELAAGLVRRLDQMVAAGHEARSQAERRIAGNGIRAGDAARLSEELLRSEAHLAAVESRIRTAESYDVSLEASYSDSDMWDGSAGAGSGVGARVKFSMKLGAFTPGRYDHERRATAARAAAIRSEEGGLLWQVDALRQAHLRALGGLEEALAELDRSDARARALLRKLGEAPSVEFAGAVIGARIERVAIVAQRAGIAGSIAEIRGNLARLGG